MSFNNPTINSYRGSFLIDEHYSREVNRDFPDTAGNVGTYGLFTGGYLGSAVSSIDKIDFSNDTSYSSLNLANNRYVHATVSNANFGWIVSGRSPSWSPTQVTVVDRLDFSSSTLTRVGNVSKQREDIGTFSTSAYGWLLGGNNGTYSDVDRIDFSNDLALTGVRGILATNKGKNGSTNNGIFGWSAGTNGPSQGSTVDRLNFANDLATSITRGPLSSVRYGAAGSGNSNYGWFGGGFYFVPPSTWYSYIDRIDYSNDSVAAVLRSTLPTARTSTSGAVGNTGFGWWGGGNVPTVNYVSNVERVDFSNDTSTPAVRSNLASARHSLSGVSNYVKAYPVYYSLNSDTQVGGYSWNVGGLYGGVYSSSVERKDFSNDSATAVARSPTSLTRTLMNGLSNANYGWFGGGYSQPTASIRSEVERMDFSNDLNLPLSNRGVLTQSRYNYGTLGTSNYGWFTGGYTPNVGSIVDRIDYANDQTSAVARNVLPTNLYRHSTASNTNFGYTATGATSNGATMISSFFRTEFTNDMIAALSRGGVAVPRYLSAGTGNLYYGWFGGGYSPTVPAANRSIIERLDYSSDTTAASTRGPLTVARIYLGASGNSNYGWWTGGTPAATSLVERLDYANDASSASVRGPLSNTRYAHANTANYVNSLSFTYRGNLFDAKYGWSAGGGIPGGAATSSVERTDFSNDAASNIARSPLLLTRADAMGVNNQFYGWVAGGTIPSGTGTSVERIDFSADSQAATARGSLAYYVKLATTVFNENFGYVATGYNFTFPYITDWCRIDYANDLTTATKRTQGTSQISAAAGIGNYNSGYITGGDQYGTGGDVSWITRITYANDTSLVSRGNLSTSKAGHGAVGNANYGWFGGGYAFTAPSGLSTVERIDYANDSAVSLSRGTLDRNITGLNSNLNNSTTGWFSLNGSQQMFRLSFATDTTTPPALTIKLAVTSYPVGLSNNVIKLPQSNVVNYTKGTTTVGVGAGTYGWHVGGQIAPASVSTVDRIDFNNDTGTASVRTSLPSNGQRHGTANTANYGWIIAGQNFGLPNISSVVRMDYANDIAASISRSAVGTAGNGINGTMCNTIYGYHLPTSLGISYIYRISFSDDTSTPTLRANQIYLGNYPNALSNSIYGWTLGADGGNGTAVTRLNFSNDLNTLSIRAPLQIGRYGMGATGNSLYGYAGGGLVIAAPASSYSIERIDYSNDTATPLSRGTLSLARWYIGAFSSVYQGWFLGGSNGTTFTVIDRITFSNDTAAASLRGPMSSGRYYSGDMSNSTK